MSHESKTTTDPEEIKKWAEQRDGRPAVVEGTDILRINFPGGAEDSLQDISWEEFFQKFEENNLAFLYQEETSEGDTSRFFKLVDREQVKAKV